MITSKMFLRQHIQIFIKEADLMQNDHILYRADSRNDSTTRVKQSS
ncbi:hypothetical protein [Brevinema andersonii]|nr:hypothetical protein [Brevinema andersonii]